MFNALLLYRGLRREQVLEHSPGWMPLMVRVLVANTAMVAVLWGMFRPLDWWLGSDFAVRVTWLGVSILAGAAIYAIVLFSTGLRTSSLRMQQ